LGTEGAVAATLERVAIVERHGVRSPTKSPDQLSRYSAERWPDWPVGVGELTPHGASDISRMAAWLRAHYAASGLWPARGCIDPGSVTVWADGKDERTRDSGQAFLDAAFPDCGFTALHGPDGETDPVFDAIEAGACPIDPEAARQSVLTAAGGAITPETKIYETAKTALYDVLSPPAGRAPCRDDAGTCFLSGRDAVDAGKAGVKLSGPLSTAATLAESILLEYGEGMPAGSVGWGRADAATIARFMPLHARMADLMRRSPYLASHNGAVLAQKVMAALLGDAGFPGEAANARLTVIAGHDTNLSNLAGILGTDWTLPGQPDKTPPGGALAFELWRDAAGDRVKIVFFYQTLEQLRDGAMLDASHATGCGVPQIQQKLIGSLPKECLRH
jgi:4-phytase/acid phosphatase